jgi:hypothetical protein
MFNQFIRFILCIIIYSSFSLLNTSSVIAETVSWDSREVKIVLIYNFARFITWPDEQKSDDLNVCVDSHADIFPLANAKLNNKVIRKRKIQVYEKQQINDIENCHIIYIADNQESIQSQLLESADFPILTISEYHDFIASGGMIRLLVKNRRIYFEINNVPATDVGLSISSNLMKLSRKL